MLYRGGGGHWGLVYGTEKEGGATKSLGATNLEVSNLNKNDGLKTVFVYEHDVCVCVYVCSPTHFTLYQAHSNAEQERVKLSKIFNPYLSQMMEN